jgi:hypothetical protein
MNTPNNTPMPKGRHHNHSSGAHHYRWNGGRTLSKHGYWKARIPDHPNADSNGYVYEHLLVWLSHGNPSPQADEVIHHCNGNKQDNRIENLRIEKRTAHSTGHNIAVSDSGVRMIRELYASKAFTMPQLAAKFQIPVSRVSLYIRGESRLIAGGPISVSNRTGVQLAGRKLQGREWNEYPQE